MAKIKLGAAPKEFPYKITFPLLQGGKEEFTVKFRYRDRAAFAEFIDQTYPHIKKPDPVSSEPGFDVIEGSAKAREGEVRYIMGCVVGWDLEEDFIEANVKLLVNEFPAAAAAITSAYRDAITEGRVKN